MTQPHPNPNPTHQAPTSPASLAPASLSCPFTSFRKRRDPPADFASWKTLLPHVKRFHLGSPLALASSTSAQTGAFLTTPCRTQLPPLIRVRGVQAQAPLLPTVSPMLQRPPQIIQAKSPVWRGERACPILPPSRKYRPASAATHGRQTRPPPPAHP